MSVSMNGSSVLVSGGTQGYEPALKNRYTVTIDRAPQGLSVDFGALNFAVQTFNPGSKYIEAGVMNIQNRQIKYPLRKAAHADVPLTLMVFGGKNNPAYDFFWNWSELVYKSDTDEVGLVGPNATGSCDGDLSVQVLGPDGSPIASVKLYCCWVNKFEIGDLDRRADADAVIASVSIVTNGWEWSYNSNGTGGGGGVDGSSAASNAAVGNIA